MSQRTHWEWGCETSRPHPKRSPPALLSGRWISGVSLAPGFWCEGGEGGRVCARLWGSGAEVPPQAFLSLSSHRTIKTAGSAILPQPGWMLVSNERWRFGTGGPGALGREILSRDCQERKEGASLFRLLVWTTLVHHRSGEYSRYKNMYLVYRFPLKWLIICVLGRRTCFWMFKKN